MNTLLATQIRICCRSRIVSHVDLGMAGTITVFSLSLKARRSGLALILSELLAAGIAVRAYRYSAGGSFALEQCYYWDLIFSTSLTRWPTRTSMLLANLHYIPVPDWRNSL